MECAPLPRAGPQLGAANFGRRNRRPARPGPHPVARAGGLCGGGRATLAAQPQLLAAAGAAPLGRGGPGADGGAVAILAAQQPAGAYRIRPPRVCTRLGAVRCRSGLCARPPRRAASPGRVQRHPGVFMGRHAGPARPGPCAAAASLGPHGRAGRCLGLPARDGR